MVSLLVVSCLQNEFGMSPTTFCQLPKGRARLNSVPHLQTSAIADVRCKGLVPQWNIKSYQISATGSYDHCGNVPHLCTYVFCRVEREGRKWKKWIRIICAVCSDKLKSFMMKWQDSISAPDANERDYGEQHAHGSDEVRGKVAVLLSLHMHFVIRSCEVHSRCSPFL